MTKKDELIENDEAPATEVQRDRPSSARTFSLNDEIESFTKFVVERVVPTKRSRWSEQIEARWKQIAAAFSNKTPSTQKLYVSKFRKALLIALDAAEADETRRAVVMEDLRNIVKIGFQVYAEINAGYREKIVSNTRKLVFVPNYERIVKAARSWLDGESDELRAIAIMLLTGRRFYEVLVAGTFAPTTVLVELPHGRGRVVPTWRMDFSGQLKTREGEGTKFNTLYNIPTLAPVKLIVAAVERLRSSSLGRTASSMGQEYANTHLNPALNKALTGSKIAELWPKGAELSIKSLRALYAEICFKHHAPAGVHKDAYFAEILGHSEGNLNTALSYVRFYLDEKDGDAARAELDAMISSAEEREEQYQTENPKPKVVRKSRHDPEPGDVSPDIIMSRLRGAKVSMTAIAEKSGCHRSTVWRNLVGSGSAAVHQAVAESLGVPASELWPSQYKQA